MARPMSTVAGPTTLTTTVTLENPTASTSSHPQQPQQQTLVLRLNRKKKVSWKEGTVDNEFMQKKSSKKCCVFHKQKPFDEDDSDQDDDLDHNHHHDHACSSKDN